MPTPALPSLPEIPTARLRPPHADDTTPRSRCFSLPGVAKRGCTLDRVGTPVPSG